MWRHEPHWWKQKRQRTRWYLLSGATSLEQTRDRPYATQLGARVRIRRRARSRSLSCSELTRACANSPATPTRSITRPAWQASGRGGGLTQRVRGSPTGSLRLPLSRTTVEGDGARVHPTAAL